MPLHKCGYYSNKSWVMRKKADLDELGPACLS
jgi:hypothetical protein